MPNNPTFNHTAHKAMWDWLSNNPGAFKEDWPGWGDCTTVSLNYCFACEYTFQVTGIENIPYFGVCIDYCPLVWKGTGICISRDGEALFSQWNIASFIHKPFNADECRHLAQIIRDLPLKKGIQTI